MIKLQRNQARTRRFRPAWTLLVLSFLHFSYCLAQDVRADLSSNNQLRIENRRGDVIVEVWNEQHVSVAVSFAGDQPATSPVIIRRTNQLLNVMVARDATSSKPTRVTLFLRVPARARVEIFTNDGKVEIRGVSEKLNVQTRAGNIQFEFSKPTDQLGIHAKAPIGKISALIPNSAPVKDVPTFVTANTKQDKNVQLTSQTGSIEILGGVDLRKSEGTFAEVRKPPTLTGVNTDTQGVGTPTLPLAGDPQEIDEGDVIRVDTELVTLNVSVVDRATSRGLKGLARSDFKLFEDGTEQEIGHFESSNAPFNMVLVIDLSGSTKDKLALIRKAAQHFVDAARTEDSIAVIAFAGTSVLVSPLTSDRNDLRRRINEMETAPGDTKLYDSLNFAMTDGLKNASSLRRNAIVVMSDGLDGTLPSVKGDGSALRYAEVLNQIREFNGVLYTLWVDTEYESLSDKDTQPEDFDAGHDRMAEFADAGGGLFYEVERLEDLADAYERVVADIGTVYSLAYRPSNSVRDGKWRSIRVKVDLPGAVARGKGGYYAN